MRSNKLEKSHIHILKSDTLSRESRVTESAQEIVDSNNYSSDLYNYAYHMSKLLSLLVDVCFTRIGVLLGDCLTL